MMTVADTPTVQPGSSSALAALSTNWRLYAIEAALLGTFMVSACTFTALLELPGSPIHRAIPSEFARRSIIGLAMGVTAVVLIYSRWGKRSGAHMNPAFTLCFLWVGKIKAWDAAFYAVSQFIGAILGVGLSAVIGGSLVRRPPVGYVATLPGTHGAAAAWAGEFIISFVMMAMVLLVNRWPKLGARTGWFAGLLVAIYITFEAPLSGMSLNPARTLGSALVAQNWSSLWIYFTAPVAGMLTAVEIHRLYAGHALHLCARLNHCRHTPSIFPCNCHRRVGIELARPEV